MKRLSAKQVIALQTELIYETGGEDGIRDAGLLDAALNAPFATFGGEDMYPSIQQKAARLGYGLVRNHAFVDGNKRIGAHVMLIFLALNGIELRYEDEELVHVILNVAEGKTGVEVLLEWLIEHQA